MIKCPADSILLMLIAVLPCLEARFFHLGFQERDLGADHFAVFRLGGDERFQQFVNTPLVILIALLDLAFNFSEAFVHLQHFERGGLLRGQQLRPV